MIKELNNPLSGDYIELKNFILSCDFPWFRFANTTHNISDDSIEMFSHTFLERPEANKGYSKANSPYIDGCIDVVKQILIANNIKFDLLWLWEAGFKYDGRVYDTMVGEYVMNKGIKRGLKLKDCCAYRGVIQKSDLTAQYIKDKVSFENIPIHIVEEYGKLDVKATRSLYEAQMLQLKKPQHKHLINTLEDEVFQFIVRTQTTCIRRIEDDKKRD